MNNNLRKELVLPLIIIAAVIIALLAGLTTYRIVDNKDDVLCEIKEFDVGTKLNEKDEPLLDEEYIKDNDGYVYLLYEDDNIYIAPSNYDREEHESFKDNLKKVEISETLKVKNYNSEWIVRDSVYKHEIKVEDLTKDDFWNILENGSPYCYIWMKNNTIEKVLFYGELVIYE